MTALLTVAAVVATLSLIVSATRTGAQATAADPNKRGSWGIAKWHNRRDRPLNPHERRWQTSLIAGKDNSTRWNSVADEIAALERVRGIDPAAPRPSSHNHQWIEASIANLEKSMSDTTTPGDPAK